MGIFCRLSNIREQGANFVRVRGEERERDRKSDLSPRRILREMAIDGLIILDSTNVKPIVQTSFRSFPPAYPLLHIDAFRAALDKAARPEDIDPVLLVNLPDAPTACCHLQHRSLTFLCPISRDCELFPWSQIYAYTLRSCLHISRSIICLCVHSHLSRHPHRILWRSYCTDTEG